MRLPTNQNIDFYDFEMMVSCEMKEMRVVENFQCFLIEMVFLIHHFVFDLDFEMVDHEMMMVDFEMVDQIEMIDFEMVSLPLPSTNINLSIKHLLKVK